jgi:hypothetical protein
MVDQLTFGFRELGLLVAERITGDEEAVFEAYIDERPFSANLEARCRGAEGIIDIRMHFPEKFVEVSGADVHKVINLVNLQLMDIGHFVLDPSTMDILLVASIDLYGDESQREQVVTTLKRVTGQAFQCFSALLRMLASDPVKVMNDLVMGLMARHNSKPDTLH